MIRHVWSVLCSRAIIDQSTNNVSLLDVMEQVQATANVPVQFPANVPFEATLVSLWARREWGRPVSGQMRIRVIGPSGRSLLQGTTGIDLESTKRHRTLSQFSGMRFEGSGVHEFEVSCRVGEADEWQTVALVPFEFTFQADAAAIGTKADQAATAMQGEIKPAAPTMDKA